MKLAGISLVRDEVDVIRANVLHSLSLGLDFLYIIDNGSTDGTARELRRLQHDPRLRWTRHESPYHAGEMLTGLAREAFAAGATWLMTIDADEFWTTTGRRGLREVLACTNAAMLRVGLINFVQHRNQRQRSPQALLRMTRRARVPIGPYRITKDLVTNQLAAYVAAEYSSKVITRTALGMAVEKGGHFVHGVEGEERPSDEIVGLHAPLRARDVLDKKAMHGQRVEEVGFTGDESWHLRRWRRLRDAGGLDAEWAANSYLRNELDVYGRRYPLAFDPTLRNLIARWVEPGVVSREGRGEWPAIPEIQ